MWLESRRSPPPGCFELNQCEKKDLRTHPTCAISSVPPLTLNSWEPRDPKTRGRLHICFRTNVQPELAAKNALNIVALSEDLDCCFLQELSILFRISFSIRHAEPPAGADHSRRLGLCAAFRGQCHLAGAQTELRPP